MTRDRWVSASALKRALICPASTVLPRSKKPFSKNAKSAADFGTKAHTYVEDGIILPGMEEWCSRIDRDKLYPSRGWHEVVAYYNPVTEEFGLRPPGDGPRTHRDYDWIPDEALVGTIDFLCPAKGGRWWVDDLKTTSMFPPGPDDPQMLFAGTVISHVFDCEVVSTITHVPRYPKGREPRRQRCDITRDFAKRYKEKLDIVYARHVLEKQRQQNGIITDIYSEHCKYCPSRTYCPTGKDLK